MTSQEDEARKRDELLAKKQEARAMLAAEEASLGKKSESRKMTLAQIQGVPEPRTLKNKDVVGMDDGGILHPNANHALRDELTEMTEEGHIHGGIVSNASQFFSAKCLRSCRFS